MDQIIAKVKRKRRKQYFKLISDEVLFETVAIDFNSCIDYDPDHNLDEDSWFKIEQFSQQDFCIDLLKKNFDSKDFDDLTKKQFSDITYLISIQKDDFYFQKITPSLFIKRKTLIFGEAVKLDESKNRLIVNPVPDAVYFKESDVLIFRNLAAISSIFRGIDELYREATNEEVTQFLSQSFIELESGYNTNRVSKPNRRRIGLAMVTLQNMSKEDRDNLSNYINEYCIDKLNYDKNKQKFKITTDTDLKLLLYGIEQRFYTTPFGHEKRIANSVFLLE
ncbi:hypothetical protein LMG33818_001765 [Halomonadaceae bacterium LMG 33818]|uniref:hypothetical protein n=1 Tax=Cernens ardua TaxID=3402176 RepID=UPI003EDBBA01